MDKPVIALMGEFSAGKSTLANLLIGEGVSPVKVTATQLPPIWYTHGKGNPVVMSTEGMETEIEIEALEDVDVETTAYVRVFVQAELLELMDLIDMPGNSDPNMSADVWERVIHHANGVIWCSHANQAWRQSEAAVWESMPDELYPNSMLLLTRFDKIREERDGKRIVARVASEAAEMFAGIFPVALLQAQQAGDDREMWEKSGATPFLECLIDIAMRGGADVVASTDEKAGDGPLVLTETELVEPKVSVLPRRVKRTDDEGTGQIRRQRPVA